MKFLPKSWKTFHEWVQRTSGIFLNSRRESLYLQAAMECSIYYINTNEIQNHFTLIVFWCERRNLFYEAIATVIFSHVKRTCYFHMWRYQAFAQKLTWYFIGVYIINWYIKRLALSQGYYCHCLVPLPGIQKCWL